MQICSKQICQSMENFSVYSSTFYLMEDCNGSHFNANMFQTDMPVNGILQCILKHILLNGRLQWEPF